MTQPSRRQSRRSLVALAATFALAVTAGLTLSAGTAAPASASLPCSQKVINDWFDNGKIDHNFLGLPAEALGFSNGFSPGLFTGMPTFQKLKFVFGASARALRIRVK